MKKSGLLIVLSLLYVSGLKGFMLDGKIITNDNDTISAKILVNTTTFSKDPTYLKLQYEVKYRRPNDEELQVITPKQAKEVQLNMGSRLIRLISCHVVKTSGIDTRAFLRMQVDGQYKLYIFYEMFVNPHRPTFSSDFFNVYSSTMPYWVVQKGDGYAIVLAKSFEYEKELAGYFDGCPEIQRKIDAGKLRRRRLPKTITYYNDNCI